MSKDRRRDGGEGKGLDEPGFPEVDFEDHVLLKTNAEGGEQVSDASEGGRSRRQKERLN